VRHLVLGPVSVSVVVDCISQCGQSMVVGRAVFPVLARAHFLVRSQCWPVHFLVTPGASPSVGPSATPEFHPSVGWPNSSKSVYADEPARTGDGPNGDPSVSVLNLALLPVRLPVFVLVPHPVMAYSSPSVLCIPLSTSPSYSLEFVPGCSVPLLTMPSGR
jgi:hypothetical protein